MNFISKNQTFSRDLLRRSFTAIFLVGVCVVLSFLPFSVGRLVVYGLAGTMCVEWWYACFKSGVFTMHVVDGIKVLEWKKIFTFFGMMIFMLTGIAVVTVGDMKSHHSLIIIGLMACSSDTVSYIAGSLLKGPKLCPSISPNKTLWGALASVGVFAIYGAFLGYALAGFDPVYEMETGHYIDPTLGERIRTMLFVGFLFSVFSVVAQAGDLWVSKAKRICGMKDAGFLLPGHGGLLDRFGSWLMLAVFFACIYLVFLIFRGPTH